jgi:hypothetical protein
MREYRICLYDHLGHLVAPAQIISAADDEAAVREASGFLDGRYIEIWEGQFARLVRRLAPLEGE